MNRAVKMGMTALRLAGITGLLLGNSLQKQKVIMYHGVYSNNVDGDPLAFGISEEDFRASLHFFKSKGFRFLTPTQYFNGENGILLTLDDCYSNNRSIVLPILEELNIPAIVFVTLQHLRNKSEEFSDFLPYFRTLIPANYEPEFIEKNANVIRNSWNGTTYSELLELANHDLITIGAHTINHPNLPELSPADQASQILGSKSELEVLLNIPVTLFSYPYGAFTVTTAKIVSEHFDYAFSVTHAEREVSNNFQIPRIGLYQATPEYLMSSMVYR